MVEPPLNVEFARRLVAPAMIGIIRETMKQKGLGLKAVRGDVPELHAERWMVSIGMLDLGVHRLHARQGPILHAAVSTRHTRGLIAPFDQFAAVVAALCRMILLARTLDLHPLHELVGGRFRVLRAARHESTEGENEGDSARMPHAQMVHYCGTVGNVSGHISPAGEWHGGGGVGCLPSVGIQDGASGRFPATNSAPPSSSSR